MNKEKFKEQAYLFLMNELNADEVVKFENAMLENDDLKREFEEIKSFYALMASTAPIEAEESVLVDARYNLMRRIRSGSEQKTAHLGFGNLIEAFLYKNYKFVFSVAFTVVIGIVIGYMMFSGKEPNQQLITATEQYNGSQPNLNGGNLQEINSPAQKDSQEDNIKFDAIKPVEQKEKTYRPVTGKILAASLLSENNPGLKLQTISRISEQNYRKGKQGDNSIKEALITALKGDPNPAVRKEAFNVLSKFPYDDKIQEAFLYTLSNDKNSGLRVMVIKALADMTFKGKTLDDKTKTVLSKKAETDNNGYVRIHAATMIKEVE